MSLDLKMGQDPDELSTAIAQLEIEYRNDLQESNKVAALVSAVGLQYASLIHSETMIIERAGEEVTCDVLIEAMCDDWSIGGSGKTIDKQIMPTETMLADQGCFAKICYNCGKPRHIANTCLEEKCTCLGMKYKLCDQTGLNKELCWEDPKNAHRRPRGWVSCLKKTKSEEAIETLVQFLVEAMKNLIWCQKCTSG